MDIISQIDNDLNELANHKEQLEAKQKEEILNGIKQLITNDYVKEEPIKEPIEKEVNSEDYNEDLLNDFVNGVKSVIKFFANIFSTKLFSEDKEYLEEYNSLMEDFKNNCRIYYHIYILGDSYEHHIELDKDMNIWKDGYFRGTRITLSEAKSIIREAAKQNIAGRKDRNNTKKELFGE